MKASICARAIQILSVCVCVCVGGGGGYLKHVYIIDYSDSDLETIPTSRTNARDLLKLRINDSHMDCGNVAMVTLTL